MRVFGRGGVEELLFVDPCDGLLLCVYEGERGRERGRERERVCVVFSFFPFLLLPCSLFHGLAYETLEWKRERSNSRAEKENISTERQTAQGSLKKGQIWIREGYN